MNEKIEVEVKVNKPIDEVWEFWTNPKHIVNWNFASDDWECPNATNDLVIGGKFSYTMSAMDGSMKFDFEGTYTNVEKYSLIQYELGDKRRVSIKFITQDNGTKILESFDAETQNSIEMQRQGWQSILNNFKKYVEKDD